MNNDTPADAMQLKPCPWCGGIETNLRREFVFWVECANQDCLAEGPQRAIRSDAIEAWNTRTTSLAAQDGLVDALADDEAKALTIIANAFRAIDMKPQSLFGECYEPGAFIKSIVEQVAALASIEVKS